MKDKIDAILERELERLDARSKADPGLSLDDFRQLDLLIKTYKTLLQDLPDDPTSQSSLASSSNEELINDLQNSERTE